MPEFKNGSTVILEGSLASDEAVIQAAQVSVKGHNDPNMTEGRLTGMINHLVKNRHGCYDSDTEILTEDGWKFFPELNENDRVAVLHPDSGKIVYEVPQRIIRKEYEGPMVRIQKRDVNLLVTPDHKMWARPRVQGGFGDPVLVAAEEFYNRSYKVPASGGEREGISIPSEKAELLGFLLADGYCKGITISVRLRKGRKIAYLQSLVSTREVPRLGEASTFYLPALDPDIVRIARLTYTSDGDRTIPREILNTWDSDSIRSFLHGYIEGDGYRHGNRVTMSTVSDQLRDDLQEAGLLAGMNIQFSRTQYDRESAYGSRPVHFLSVYTDRNSETRVGWTSEERSKEVTTEHYSGEIHCVTVSSGIVYVRRGGKSLWCGNSPFEHTFFKFSVETPLFVVQEMLRHRVGTSFNQESGRYTELKPLFYVVPHGRKIAQIGKPGHYTYVEGTGEQFELLVMEYADAGTEGYARYKRLLDNGISRELASRVMPHTLFVSLYFTVNARSLMNFLSLRVEDENATFVSHPMWEIQEVAEKMEAAFAELMPRTHKAFVDNGRVAP